MPQTHTSISFAMVLARHLLVVLAVLSISALVKGRGSTRQAQGCASPELNKVYRECMSKNKASTSGMATCDKAMMDKKKSCGGGATAVDNVELRSNRKEFAEKEFADCKMKGAADCAKKFYQMSGESKPTDTVRAQNQERFESAKGAAEALANKMTQCSGDKTTCKAEARAALAKLTGQTVSKENAAAELMKAGERKAGTWVRECLAAAADETAKKSCFTSQAAKDAAAAASGRNASDLLDVDIVGAARKTAEYKIKELMSACTASKTTTADKKKCRERSDLKGMITGSLGKTNVPDSEVLKFMEKGAREDVLTAARTCVKADIEKCKEEAKAAKAKAMGRMASEVKDDELKRDVVKGLARDLGNKMMACVEQLSDDETPEQARTKCRTSFAKEEIKKAGFEDRVPTKTEIEKSLKDAGKQTAKAIAKDCDATMARTKCMDLVKDRAAKAMGKLKSQMSDYEVEKMNLAGANDAAFEAAAACAKAKKDNAAATCEDVYTAFQSVRKKSSKPSEEDVDKIRVKRDAAVTMEKDYRKICFKKPTKDEATACLQNFKSEMDGAADVLLKDLIPDHKAKMRKAVQQEASIEVIVDDFDVCMKTASTANEKATCLSGLKSMKANAGMTETADELIEKYRTNDVVKAAKACDSAQMGSCILKARDAAVQAGTKKRKFGSIKKLAEEKAAFKMFAECRAAANTTDAGCLDLAKAEYKKVSGESGTGGPPGSSGWDSNMESKIKKLGEAVLNNVEIVTRKKKQVDLELVTDKTECLVTIHDKLLIKVTDEAASLITYVTRFKKKACRLEFNSPIYKIAGGMPNATDEEIDSLADSLTTVMENANVARRLLLQEDPHRRLTSVQITTAYAAQGSEACVATDTSCGQVEADLAGGTSNTNGVPAPASSPASAPAPSDTTSGAPPRVLVVWYLTIVAVMVASRG